MIRALRRVIGAGNEPAAIDSGARVTHNFFATLGIQPMLGRAFRAEEEEDGHDRVIVLSELFWRARFNADPAVLGTKVLVDGVDHEVIGVVRGSFWRSLAGGTSNTPSDAQYEMFRPRYRTPGARSTAKIPRCQSRRSNRRKSLWTVP